MSSPHFKQLDAAGADKLLELLQDLNADNGAASPASTGPLQVQAPARPRISWVPCRGAAVTGARSPQGSHVLISKQYYNTAPELGGMVGKQFQYVLASKHGEGAASMYALTSVSAAGSLLARRRLELQLGPRLRQAQPQPPLALHRAASPPPAPAPPHAPPFPLTAPAMPPSHATSAFAAAPAGRALGQPAHRAAR
jgi:hypothetical protein